MDVKTLDFLTYCISKLTRELNLPQNEVYRRLTVSGILDGYLIPSYDVLHTFGSRYLMDGLTDFMYNVSLTEAANIFYQSETSRLI